MSDRDGAGKPRHSKGLRATVAEALAAPTPVGSAGNAQAGARPQGGTPAGSNEAAAEKGLYRKVAQRIARRDALLAPASAPSKLLTAVTLLGASLGVSVAAPLDGAGPAAKSAVVGEKLAQSVQVKAQKRLESKQLKIEKRRRKRAILILKRRRQETIIKR